MREERIITPPLLIYYHSHLFEISILFAYIYNACTCVYFVCFLICLTSYVLEFKGPTFHQFRKLKEPKFCFITTPGPNMSRPGTKIKSETHNFFYKILSKFDATTSKFKIGNKHVINLLSQYHFFTF